MAQSVTPKTAAVSGVNCPRLDRSQPKINHAHHPISARRRAAMPSAFLRHAQSNLAPGTGTESGLEELASAKMAAVFSSYYDRAIAEGAFRVEQFQLDSLIL